MPPLPGYSGAAGLRRWKRKTAVVHTASRPPGRLHCANNSRHCIRSSPLVNNDWLQAKRHRMTPCTTVISYELIIHAIPEGKIMSKRSTSQNVPKEMQARFDEITRLTDSFSEAHLNGEYKDHIRQLTATLCRKR